MTAVDSTGQLGVVAPGRTTTAATGLSANEVADRIAAGQTNASEVRTSRTMHEIIRANVFTLFNGILTVLFVAIMTTGRWQNGLFGLVVVANAAIGIVQETRAKRILDRLAILQIPHARVIRDGTSSVIDVADVVLDDLIEIQAGSQVPADGIVRSSHGLEIDESPLTGESEPVAKQVEQQVLSGSIVVAGAGVFQATQVGPQSFAIRLALESRRFALTRSELVASTNRLLRWISIMLILVAPLLIWSQFRSSDNHGWQDAITGTVAALVGMVPEGLVLLTSLAFVVASVSLVRQSTLIQELPAVEVLARVDVVCLDKTGTLTYGDIGFSALEICPDFDEEAVRRALGTIIRAADSNTTAAALLPEFPETDLVVTRNVPFSSARKWSAIVTGEAGSWVMGAPEMVVHTPTSSAQLQALSRANMIAGEGARVLLLAHTSVADDIGADVELPADLRPAGLIVLAERVRDDARQTLEYFAEQGVSIKVISGDNSRTVGAIAASLGVPGVTDAKDAVDARTLPEAPDELAAILDEFSAFGRVTPQQKRAFVQALQRRGRVVAMTGDGVNDALALKDADIGVAMGNGSEATRAVAQIILLDGRFSHLPTVVAEGRRVIANIERAANLFVVKNIYAFVLAIIVASTGRAYPLAPIQLTLISTLTIGIPAFVLALGPNTRRYVPGFLPRVLRFSLPVGLLIGASSYVGYQATRLTESGATVAQARTTATLVVLLTSLWTLTILARPLAGWKVALVGAMALFTVVLVVVKPVGHGLFLLDVSLLRVVLAIVVGVVGALVIELFHRIAAAPSVSRE